MHAGFADPVLSAQKTFRALLDATARPGTVHLIAPPATAPAPLSLGAAAIALTLSDQDTRVWLDAPLREADGVGDWLRFHCGARVVDPPDAATLAFAAAPSALPAFTSFNLGTQDYPDRSTTIVLQVDSFESGPKLELEGPGIRGRCCLQASPLPADILEQLARNRALFPRGIDLLVVTGERVAALPRAVRATLVPED